MPGSYVDVYLGAVASVVRLRRSGYVTNVHGAFGTLRILLCNHLVIVFVVVLLRVHDLTLAKGGGRGRHRLIRNDVHAGTLHR